MPIIVANSFISNGSLGILASSNNSAKVLGRPDSVLSAFNE